jgi:uncharacterized protein (DUF885 family)
VTLLPSFLAAALLATASYPELVQAYFDDRFAYAPTGATMAGRHDQDGRLEDFTLAGARANAASLRTYRSAFQAIDPAKLSATDAADREMVLGSIDGRLLKLEEERPLENRPDVYSSGITISAFSLFNRNYAPAPVRMRALVARLRQMPAALQAARTNLQHPPRENTEIARAQLDGNRRVFTDVIPAAFKGVGDVRDQADLAAGCQAVADALAAYKSWMEHDLLPRSTGSFALGAERFRRKLKAEEGVDVPVERLIAIGEQDLARNQAALAALCARMEPGATPAQVYANLAKRHPAGARLLAETQADVDDAVKFLAAKDLVTVPPAGAVQVVETPPYMRATTTASMDTPGPLEAARQTVSYFFMTLPNPAWPAAQQDRYLGQFFPERLSNMAVHEVIPGHYLQHLVTPRLPTLARKLIEVNTLEEGWAHYCEQMMLDEGFHADDPRYRLAQLQDAVLRDVRLLVGAKLHTAGWTIPQAAAYFEREAYQSPESAKQEAWRAINDPLYGYYTLGKLMILKLRADWQRQHPAGAPLKAFHDALLAQGRVPMPVIRKALLGEVGDPLP